MWSSVFHLYFCISCTLGSPKPNIFLIETNENVNNEKISKAVVPNIVEEKGKDYSSASDGGLSSQCSGTPSEKVKIDSSAQKYGVCDPVTIYCLGGGCMQIESFSYGCSPGGEII